MRQPRAYLEKVSRGSRDDLAGPTGEDPCSAPSLCLSWPRRPSPPRPARHRSPTALRRPRKARHAAAGRGAVTLWTVEGWAASYYAYTPPRTTRSHERYASMSRYRVWIFPAALLIESGGNRRVNLEVTGVRADSCARAGGQRLSAALSVWSVLLCGESVSATCDAPRVRVVTAHDTSRYSMPFWQVHRAEYMGAVARPRTALGRRWRWRQQRW